MPIKKDVRMHDTQGLPMAGTACPDDAPRTVTAHEETRLAHAGCMVCGDGGPGAPTFGLRFLADATGSILATFRTARRYQGYQGILHGGVISTLLDAAMVHCLFARGVTAVTAEMTVRFLREVPVDRDIAVGATLAGERHGVFQVWASLWHRTTRFAVAKGKFCRAAR
jgi:uncharacterized protein (TIGR00369 family)